MKLQVPSNNTQVLQLFMYAHIIDSINERQRIEHENFIHPQNGTTVKQIQNPDKNKPKEGAFVSTPDESLQIRDDSLKKLSHSSIENAIHPTRQSSVEAHKPSKEWSAEVKRLSAAVNSLHWELHYDSTLVERLFSSVVSNIGNPFSFSPSSSHCEKGATVYHS